MSAKESLDKSKANEALLALRLSHFREVSSFFETAIEKAKDERLATPATAPDTAAALISRAVTNVNFVANVPNLFRRALFVAAYSMLETHLNLLAIDYQQSHALTISLDDIRGRGVERAKLYLQKVAGIPFPDDSPEWQTLQRLGEVRNVLVHRYGRVDQGERDKKLVTWMETNPHINVLPWGGSLLWGGVIWLTPTFTDYAITNIEGLFRKLGYQFFGEEGSSAQ